MAEHSLFGPRIISILGICFSIAHRHISTEVTFQIVDIYIKFYYEFSKLELFLRAISPKSVYLNKKDSYYFSLSLVVE